MTKKHLLIPALLFVAGFAQAQIKNIHGPYLQNVDATEATVVWEADKPSVGWVELAPDDGTSFYSCERPKYFDCTNGVKNTSTLHSVKLHGLQPGTTYRYRIYSKEVLSHNGFLVNYNAQVAATDVFRHKPLEFHTLDPAKAETSFLLMNDIHGRAEIIPKLLEKGNYKEKDLIFFNGDMISISNKSEDFFKGFMDTCTVLFAQEKSPYYCRGNHETRGEFATHFQEYFSPRIPHLYFTLRQGPVFFIVLDTGEDKPDSDIEYSGIVDYDGYRSEQAEWLKTVKDDPLFQSATYRVAISHMPTTESKSHWHGENDCLEKFAPQLNAMNIDLLICGHYHADSYHEPGSVVQYPVLINSYEGVVSATAVASGLHVSIIRQNGKKVMEKEFPAKR